MSLDFSDIQGLVRYGYGDLTEACFLLFNIENLPTARAWLATAEVSTAAEDRPPATAMQIAFTSQGLQALGVRQDILAGFSAEFLSGMVGEESRLRRLGDVGASAPAEWQWGRPGRTPDVLLMLYAKKGCLEAWKQKLLGRLPEIGFRLLDCLNTADLDGYEPFGFRDGISQPKIDWNRERKLNGGNQLEYGNLLALGEFLLGYPNEYSEYTDRPLLDPKDDPKGHLLLAEDQLGKRDLARNGTYLVFRQLEQDVYGFWQFLDKQANSDPELRRRLAEAMVGRTMFGQPLVSLSSRPIPGVGPKTEDTSLNQFTYESDSTGTSCPFGAHIRRANPRSADLPGGTRGLLSRLIRTVGFGRGSIRDDLVASTRFHRLLRRGREYGGELLQEDAVRGGKADGEKRGIHFICLNANIARQFEFVQNAWMMDTKFDGLTEESDPLLGNRAPVSGCSFANTFSLPRKNGVRRRITGIPQFVTVRGGAYFFLPSLRALRYLATIES
jgi:deferrochelatase/peroxidase EfeB